MMIFVRFGNFVIAQINPSVFTRILVFVLSVTGLFDLLFIVELYSQNENSCNKRLVWKKISSCSWLTIYAKLLHGCTLVELLF